MDTKTEARERMSDEEFRDQPQWHTLWREAERARKSEASLNAALSALRAEHKRVSLAAIELSKELSEKKLEHQRVIAERDDIKERFGLLCSRREVAVFEAEALTNEMRANERLRSQIAEVTKERDEAKKSLQAIDKELRGKVCDPDPLKPLWNDGLTIEVVTTYGLASGLLRERDSLRAALASVTKEREMREALEAAKDPGYCPYCMRMVAEEREEIIKAVDQLDLMQWVKTRVAQAIRARSKKA